MGRCLVFFNSVWFGILGNRERWLDQIPLDRCLIETDVPYLGGWREDLIYSPFLGSEVGGIF